jgi:DNA-binding NtrC family response regulator
MLPRSGQTVRELENIIQRMIALAESEHIDADVLPPRWKPISSAKPCARRAGHGNPRHRQIDTVAQGQALWH